MKLAISAMTLALFVGGALASTAQAQQTYYPQPYIGGDALFWELNRDNGPDRDSVGLRLNGGFKFNDYFAVEGHVAGGGSDGPAELDSLVGAYAKGIVPISQEFRLYGLLGGTEVDLGGDSDNGVSYGAGAEFDMSPNLSVGADLMRYLDKSNYDVDAASVGLRYRF